MNNFIAHQSGRVLIINLKKGEEIVDAIEQACLENHLVNGVVISAIGSLRSAHMHYIETTEDNPTNTFIKLEKPMELGAMQGLILNGEPHLHLVFSEPDKTYTGHLEPGCEVQYLAEIVILELDGIDLNRVKDAYGIALIEESR